jgi:hypothetical protein
MASLSTLRFVVASNGRDGLVALVRKSDRFAELVFGRANGNGIIYCFCRRVKCWLDVLLRGKSGRSDARGRVQKTLAPEGTDETRHVYGLELACRCKRCEPVKASTSLPKCKDEGDRYLPPPTTTSGQKSTRTVAAVMDKQQQQQQPVCPYLSPEIWQRIFFQNTYPNTLWHVGRQVCSMWRYEIPKVFAKKYLENPAMLQIYYDCGSTGISGCLCDLRVDMVFDRYEEGTNNSRCVFAENPLTTGRENDGPQPDDDRFRFDYAEFRRQKFENWKKNIEFYLGVRPPHAKRKPIRASIGPFHVRLHQIRFKAKANDTELPQLEFDFERREISFEWTGMFDAFCAEAVLLEKRERGLLPESEQWLMSGKHAIAADLAFSKATKAARENVTKEVRRDRIKKWNRGRLDRKSKEKLFEAEAEDSALWSLKRFETHGDHLRCAEDAEERMVAEFMVEYREKPRLHGEVYDEFADDDDPSHEEYRRYMACSSSEAPLSDDEGSELEEVE